MKYFILPVLALTVGCSTTEQYAMVDATVQGEKISQSVVLEDNRHIRSLIGQDPITFDEIQLCDELRYEADYGPLSDRINNTGSIGACSKKTGGCAVLWLDTDTCDIIENYQTLIPSQVERRPQKSRLQQLQDAIDHCYSGEPKFGPQAPCEMLEDMYWDEQQKQR